MYTARYIYTVLAMCTGVQGCVEAYGSQQHGDADRLLGARHDCGVWNRVSEGIGSVNSGSVLLGVVDWTVVGMRARSQKSRQGIAGLLSCGGGVAGLGKVSRRRIKRRDEYDTVTTLKYRIRISAEVTNLIKLWLVVFLYLAALFKIVHALSWCTLEPLSLPSCS
jgi:hypothetical protein